MEASAPQERHPGPQCPADRCNRCERCCGTRLFGRAIVIAAAAIAAGAAHSWVVPVKVRLKPRQAQNGPVTPGPGPINPPPEQTALPEGFITLEQARALFEAGALFLDTRPREQFDAERILGAYHLSTEQFGTPEGTEILSMLSADAPYVLYCDGGECEASENVAQRLEDAFPLYQIMHDGFPAWRDAGYDIETGPPQ